MSRSGKKNVQDGREDRHADIRTNGTPAVFPPARYVASILQGEGRDMLV